MYSLSAVGTVSRKLNLDFFDKSANQQTSKHYTNNYKGGFTYNIDFFVSEIVNVDSNYTVQYDRNVLHEKCRKRDKGSFSIVTKYVLSETFSL